MPCTISATLGSIPKRRLATGYGRRDRAMRAIDAAIHECDEAVAAMH
jgi:hypothetical protein